jgi:hypothetical protein
MSWCCELLKQLQRQIPLNIVTILVWLQMGSLLVIGFIRLFDTACDYALQFTITHTHTHTHTSVHSHVFIAVAW